MDKKQELYGDWVKQISNDLDTKMRMIPLNLGYAINMRTRLGY